MVKTKARITYQEIMETLEGIKLYIIFLRVHPEYANKEELEELQASLLQFKQKLEEA